MENRAIGRGTVKNLEKLTAVKVVKGKKLDSVEGCNELTMEIVNKFADRKYYPIVDELNKEIEMQRDIAALYKEDVDKAVKRIKELEQELAEADNCFEINDSYLELFSKNEKLRNALREEKEKKNKTFHFILSPTFAITLIIITFLIFQTVKAL